MDWHFALDFDGTICPVDVTDFILERFAAPAWHDIEAEWERGAITTRECLRRQVGLIDADPTEIDAALTEIRLDPAFPAFVGTALAAGASVSVISDGFDRFIRTLLVAGGTRLPFSANRLLHLGGRRWEAQFGSQTPACPNGSCKCLAAGEMARRVILVGDGRSDFCLARHADFVLAKGRLAAFCREHALPHQPIAGFEDALAWLARTPLSSLSPLPTPGQSGRRPETLHA
ncbi:2,3-diketo-5-methylthio-1-phosphopentane phosphatase [Azorhizobium oxalatiphilum]|uniref:2,3-diketo-5-methylthio-1-phosphopentane phosphatase n=1 Tax=Azorhizobium oxalatiphilum TaxID=980631 RepID=A0A917BND0_9HYPH|nr:HAD-IB family phosphatase [Azorhizobium oxalatiphilum]GGF50655.1 2,3-diketo-5-methylthio-1-phosphopentane phosphatase [Azorhizobium oxalatiphilum]